MKNNVLRASAALFFFIVLGSISSFASDGTGTEGTSFWQKLGDNIWYILLVVAFGAGLIIINRWQAKIRARDEKFKKEYGEWKEEHPEEAEMLETGSKITDAPVEEESDGETALKESAQEAAEEIEKDEKPD